MNRNFFAAAFSIAIAIFLGCASADQTKTVRVGMVVGSVDFSIIGSYGQQSDPQTLTDSSVSLPVDGVPVPLDVLLNQTGSASNVTIDIAEIGEDFRLKIIGSGIQNAGSYTVRTASDTVTVGKEKK